MAQIPMARLDRRFHRRRTAFSLLAALAFAMVPGFASAQIDRLYDSDAGTWSTTTDWLAGVADVPLIPTTGDWIILDSTMSLSGNEAFGNGTNGSTWTSGNLNLTGNTLTHVAGSTWTFSGTSDRNLDGGNLATSDLINSGLFTHDTNRRLRINSGATFRNEGTFEFTTSSGSVRSDNTAGGTFLNAAGGVLESTNTTGTVRFDDNSVDRMVVQNEIGAVVRAAGSGGALRLDGKLDDLGGTIAALDGARLEVIGANNSAVAGTSWDTVGTGKIELGGTWGGTGSDLLGTVGGTGHVVIGETLQAAGNFAIDLDVALASGGNGSLNGDATPVAGTLGWDAGSIQPNGNTITLDTPVSYNSTGDRNINGPGTVLNSAGQTFTHDTNRRLRINSGATFRNEGTFEFTTSSGSVRSDNTAGGTFLNAAGGVLESTNTTGTVRFDDNSVDRMVVQNEIGAVVRAAGSGGALRLDGKLDDLGGTIAALDGARLEVIGANNSAVAGTSWDTVGTGKIELGGTWGGTGSDLLGTVGGTGHVVIGETLQAAGNFAIDLDVALASGGNGSLNGDATPVAGTLGWDAGSIQPNGNTITLDTPVSYNSTGDRNINGPGTVLNSAGQTFTHDTNRRLRINSGATFRNEGTFEFTTSSGSVRSDNTAGGTFLNAAGGVLESTNTTGTVRFDDNSVDRMVVQNEIGAVVRAAGSGGALRLDGKLDDLGGTIAALDGARLEVIGANNSAVAGTSWDTVGTGKIELGGTWGGTGSDLLGTVGGTGHVVIGETLQAAGNFAIDLDVALASGGNGSLNGDATPVAGTLGWDAGSIQPNGNTITLDTPVSYNSTGDRNINGPGTVLNSAGQTFTHDTNRRLRINSGATFRNEGTFEFTTSSGSVRSDNTAGGTFLNAAGGLLRATDTTGTVRFDTNAPNRLTLDNQGTLEVLAQTSNSRMDVQGGGSSVVVPQFDGVDTLTGGTWKVTAEGTNNATLNLDPANAGITLIGGGATVVISTTGTGLATFTELAGLETVAGAFEVNGTANFDSTAATLTVVSGGILSGTGTLSDDITVQGGGFLTPGSTMFSEVDILNFPGPLTLDPLSLTTLQLLSPMGMVPSLDPVAIAAAVAAIDPTTSQSDGLEIGGAFTAAGTFDLVLDSGYVPMSGDAWDLVDFPSISGIPTFNVVGSLGSFTLDTSLFSSDGIVFLVGVTDPIPEPSRALLLLLGLGAVLLRRRR